MIVMMWLMKRYADDALLLANVVMNSYWHVAIGLASVVYCTCYSSSIIEVIGWCTGGSLVNERVPGGTGLLWFDTGNMVVVICTVEMWLLE